MKWQNLTPIKSCKILAMKCTPDYAMTLFIEPRIVECQ